MYFPIVQPIGTTLPGISLEADDRDIPYGDWIDYTIVHNSSEGQLFRASNITHRVYVIGELNCQPGQPEVIYNLQVC